MLALHPTPLSISDEPPAQEQLSCVAGPGGNWVGSGGYQAPNGAWVSTGPYSCDFGNIPMTQEEKCQKAQRDMTYGGGGMAGKTLVKKLPLVGTIGAFLFLQGLYNWGKNDCGGGFG